VPSPGQIAVRLTLGTEWSWQGDLLELVDDSDQQVQSTVSAPDSAGVAEHVFSSLELAPGKYRARQRVLAAGATQQLHSNVVNVPPYYWEKNHGGPDLDCAWSLDLTADGGYLLAGVVDGGDDYLVEGDYYLAKTDGAGELLWEKTFGGDQPDWAFYAIETSDGGAVVVGAAASFSIDSEQPHFDAYVVRTDDTGEPMWTAQWGGERLDLAYSVVQTQDGGFVVTGGTDVGAGDIDAVLFKLSSSGNLLWEKTFGGTGTDWGQSIVQTPDGGLAIAGPTSSTGAGAMDGCVIRTDAAGNTLWQRTYGAAGTDAALHIAHTEDGGFILSGKSDSRGDDPGFYLLRIDEDGELLWEQSYGGGEGGRAWAARPTSDGGFIATGNADSSTYDTSDVYVVKTDGQGHEQWSATFGGPGYDESYAVREAPDGTYVIAGYAVPSEALKEQVFLLGIDPRANLLWQQAPVLTPGSD